MVLSRMGNGINWKGQVFPAMRNFTSSNRMTGVGNALKRHYVGFLLDYEQVRCLHCMPVSRRPNCSGSTGDGFCSLPIRYAGWQLSAMVILMT